MKVLAALFHFLSFLSHPEMFGLIMVLSTFDFSQLHKETKSRLDLSSLPTTYRSAPTDCGSVPVIDETNLIPASVGIMDDWRSILCDFV
jgi:hypothetical protein